MESLVTLVDKNPVVEICELFSVIQQISQTFQLKPDQALIFHSSKIAKRLKFKAVNLNNQDGF